MSPRDAFDFVGVGKLLRHVLAESIPYSSSQIRIEARLWIGIRPQQIGH